MKFRKESNKSLKFENGKQVVTYSFRTSYQNQTFNNIMFKINQRFKVHENFTIRSFRTIEWEIDLQEIWKPSKESWQRKYINFLPTVTLRDTRN